MNFYIFIALGKAVPQRYSVKKVFLQISQVTGKHLRWTLLKRNSNAGIFLWIL